PINFPSDRLPGWLAALHSVLPLEHSAIVMRSTLTDGLVEGAMWPSWLILAAWAVASWLASYAVMTRRG
ncbi:MAG: ABC transporter permease, partial [Dehalococcoidia bacterium]